MFLGLALAHCEAIAKLKNENRSWTSFTRQEIVTDLGNNLDTIKDVSKQNAILGHLFNCTPTTSSKLRSLTFILFVFACFISYQLLHSLRKTESPYLFNPGASSLGQEFIVKAQCETKSTHVETKIKFVWSLGEENGGANFSFSVV